MMYVIEKLVTFYGGKPDKELLTDLNGDVYAFLTKKEAEIYAQHLNSTARLYPGESGKSYSVKRKKDKGRFNVVPEVDSFFLNC